jgi:hypothetical protein
MTVQHADLFHCLACGRVAYEPHGGPAPQCCDQPMVRAVADVVKDVSPNAAAEPELRGDVEEHALFAEALELAQWCHGLRDVDISRREEFTNRLVALHRALVDQLEDAQRPAAFGHSPTDAPADGNLHERLRDQGRQLLTSFANFVSEVTSGTSVSSSWAQVCDRIDRLVAEFRQYVRTESQLTRAAIPKGNG